MTEFIDELLQRWQADPTPQLSLQLAEELRRLDRRDEAIPVLQRALEEHPNHVAAQVALGRFRLELGQKEEARRILEQVVAHDPTHLVASKLLVGLYLEAGRRRMAQDRLDLYKLLNERDPEIQMLEERLTGRRAAAVGRPLTVAEIAGRTDGGPFVGLWEGLGEEPYWQAVGAEGIFPVAGMLARSASAAAALEPESAPELESAPDTAPATFEPPPPAATLTLADLYLEQGHLDEAESTVREVLDLEPGHAAALQRLEEIERRREGPRAVAPPAAEGPVSGDLRARKIAALRQYLERIRAAAGR